MAPLEKAKEKSGSPAAPNQQWKKVPRNHLRRVPAINRLKGGLLFLCLLAPSIWMVATIPPLWRDADAYVQLTQDPRVSTFWGHAPAYCYLAKIPLFIGEQWERIGGQPSIPRIIDSQPALTDSGIWLLIALQHLGLALSAFLFIAALTQLFWVRLALVVAWASNALVYTFAHCIGSETLGLILTVVLALKGLQLIETRSEPGWKDWYGFAVVLSLCFLSRDLNLGLVAVLPVAFLISFAQNRVRRIPARNLQQLAIALAVGAACVGVAHSVPRSLARKTKLHPHSRIGFTFLWRLHFLSELSPESRTSLLQKVSARTSSDSVRHLIALLEQMHVEQADLSNPGPFMERAIKFFDGPRRWEALDHGLKEMAFTYLWPPSSEVLHAARTDFVVGLKMPPTLISEYLFATTAYYFQHQAEMPACANLATFRGEANADKISRLPFEHGYFQFWKGLTYGKAFFVWLVALLAFLFAARQRPTEAGAISAFGIALTFSGLSLFGATCVLHDFEPRFGLSLWALLFLSLFLFVGKTADYLVLPHSSNNQRGAGESPPGSHCRPEP